MSENQQPERKTWRMLKKADPSVAFETNIIPKFEVATTNVCTTTDKYGTWTCSYSNTAITTVSKAFDHDASTALVSTEFNDKKLNEYVELVLPDYVSINPTLIRQRLRHNVDKTMAYYYDFNMTVQGYDSSTDTWEVITASVLVQSDNVARDYDMPVLTDKYYSKFRFYVKNTKKNWMAYDKCITHAIEIVSGRIKKVVG